MEMDRKTKAGSSSVKLKADEKARPPAAKSNGKHAAKKRSQTTARAKTAKGKPPAIQKVTRKTQEELIGTRQRLLVTYEHAPIGINECSPEGKYVNCNEEFCRLTGYKKEELIGLGIADLTYEEDYIFDIKLHQRLVAGEIPFYKMEKRILQKGGGIIWVELTRNVIRDPEGKALFTVGALVDISERKQAEVRLRLAREQAEQTARRIARLQEVTAALSEALTPPQVAEIVVNQGAQALGAVTSSMMILAEDGQTLEILHTSSSESAVRPYRHFSISAQNPAADAARSGQSIWIESRQQYLERYPHLADQINAWGHQAGMAIPLVNQGRILGVLTLSFDQILPYTREDKDYALTLAQQAAQALERARAEDALRESEERFRAIVSQATAGIAQSDMNSRLTFVNPRLCEMLGYSESELIGKTIWELTDAEDLKENRRLFERMITQGESYQFEKRFIRRDGSKLWANVSVSAIRDSAGKPKGGVGVVVDINERKRAERALTEYAREQEALYDLTDHLHRTNSLEEIFDAALNAIFRALQCDRASILLFDDTNVMRFVAWRGLSGEYRKATEGHSPWKPDAKNPEPISVDDTRTADLTDSLKAVIEAEGIRSLAFIPLVSNGKLIGKFMVYFNALHTFGEDELNLSLTIAHQLAFGIDRARAAERLRESEARFRSLAVAVPSIVWTAAPDGTIVYANDKWYEYTGLSPEENARNWPVVLHPDDYERCVGEWTHALETVPDEYLVEVRNRRYDGQYRWFQTRAVPARDASGKVTAWYGITTDIHERIEAENRLALLAEISELTRNVEDPGELLYAISKAVGEHLQVSRCLFNEIDVEEDLEIVHRDYHDGVESVVGAHRLSDYSSITSADMRAGKTVVNTDSKFDPRTAQNYERTYEPSGERAYVAVPMMRENRWVASLWVSDDQPRQWSKEEVSLLETIAERTWTVVEKLRIAEELRAKEAELEEVINQTPFMLTRCTRDLRYRFVSRAYAQMIGRTPEEIAGKPIVEIMGKEGLKTISPYIEKVLEGQRVEYENEVPFQGTGAPFLHVVYTPDRDEHGDVIGWFGSIVDISERRQAEEKIVFQANLLSAVGSAVIATDLNGNVLYWNPAAEKLYGWSASEAIGKNILDVAPAPQWQEQAQEIMEQLSRGNSWSGEFLVQRRGGRTFPAFVSDSPILDSNGKLVGIIGVSSDITDRKKSEEALRESEEWFRAIVDQATAGIVRHGVDGRLTFVNQTFCAMLGYTEAELVGQPVWQFTHKDDIQENKGLFDRLMSEGLSFKLEKRLVRKDGSILWVDVSASPIFDAAGRPYSTVAVEVDITDRKQAEQALQELNLQLEHRVRNRTVELQIANQTLTEEINERKQVEEALRESRQHLQVLSKRLVEVQEEERRAIARELHDRVGQTLAALNINLIIMNSQLLEDSKQRIGSRMEDSMQLVTDAIALIRNVMTDLRPAVLDDYGLQAALQSYIDQFRSRYGIQVTLDPVQGDIPRLDPGLEMTVLRIAQEALTNVVRHAQAGRIGVSLQLEDQLIYLSVQDDGVGIQHSYGVSHPGSHGLKIMRERAEAYGGSVHIGPAPGKGTRVEARIPIENRGQNQV